MPGDDIFRLSGGAPDSPAVADWFANHPDELGFIAGRWFTAMRECGDDVLELVHDGFPIACVGDVPFGYVNAFKAHINVGFFRGALLPDPAGILQGTGKRMRHVKVSPVKACDEAALSMLITEAYNDVKRLA